MVWSQWAPLAPVKDLDRVHKFHDLIIRLAIDNPMFATQLVEAPAQDWYQM